MTYQLKRSKFFKERRAAEEIHQDAIDDDADSSDDIERNHALEAIEHYCIEHHEGDKSANQRMCAFTM